LTKATKHRILNRKYCSKKLSCIQVTILATIDLFKFSSEEKRCRIVQVSISGGAADCLIEPRKTTSYISLLEYASN